MAKSRTANRRATENARREKAAALRASAARAERRRRVLWAVGAVVTVLVVVAGIVTAAVMGGSEGGSKDSAAEATAVPADVLAKVSSVPAATLAAVGKGDADAPKPVTGTPLSAGGKPQVMYVGAEYCPYCAGERWPMVVALSRFGTFGGLKATHSSPTDVDPNTATFSFHGATYTSDYLDFVGKELYSNTPQGNQYAPLDTLTSAQQAQFTALSPQGGFPFVDFAGRYALTAVQYDPKLLAGQTLAQIADELADPNSKQAKAIDGAANSITATLCTLTGNKPATVCGAPLIKTLQQQQGQQG